MLRAKMASAQTLVKKGKRGAATVIQCFCANQCNLDVADDFFNYILNPENRIDDWERIDWCRWLLAGGKTPDEFSQLVRKYDDSSSCGLVWTANFVAYRCRTCAISPCMSLCSDCFQRGDHEGHDFNMFRSQAGGACDCGDNNVMKESGFCNKHTMKLEPKVHEMPSDLFHVAEMFMPRLFLRLLQHLREFPNEPDSEVIQRADGLLTMLQQHCEMGAPMREVMTRSLMNPLVYSSLNARVSKKQDSPVCTSFLDELMHWTIKYEFPQKLVCLLLNMMPDQNYKETFTKTFVHHYSKLSDLLCNTTDNDTLGNRVVHVSVQLFSNEKLAYHMAKDYSLLVVMFEGLKEMMSLIVRPSKLQCPDSNVHMVVDCSNRILKDHCYWPLISDLNNVLTHKPVALLFVNDTKLIRIWLKFLSLFQGMNMNQRELKSHVEFESNTYFAAFSAEIEVAATPMWSLISHLTNPETAEQSKNVLRECLQVLEYWFLAVGLTPSTTVNPYQVTFHLPLHRCFASFLCQAVTNQDVQLRDILPSEDTLKMLMMHPLQAQVAFHEILTGMWVRCGLQIKGQAMTYVQCHFCNSLVDADLFLLQLCATHLDPDWFVKILFESFHVWDWFSFHPNRTNNFLENDQVIPMLEGALCCLATLMSTHTKIGLSDEEVMRLDIISLLCMNDRTHSQLVDLLPDKCGLIPPHLKETEGVFESFTRKVADYKAPNFEMGGTMLQGTYVPKPEIWEKEYDPIHVLLRAVHRRDYQSSLDRYTQYLKSSGKFSGSGLPWPPFRIPGKVHPSFKDPRIILHSKVMHGIIFTILYRAVHDSDVNEQVLALCVYLLDMAVQFPNDNPVSDETDDNDSVDGPQDAIDLGFANWYASNDTLTNLSTIVHRVLVTDKVVMSMGMVEEMEVEEEEEEDEEDEMDMEGECTYHVQSPITEEDVPEPSIQEPLPETNQPLALPPASGSSSDTTIETSTSQSVVLRLPGTVQNVPQEPTDVSSNAQAVEVPPAFSSSTIGYSVRPALPLLPMASSSSSNMAIVPTALGLRTMRPRCLKIKHIPGRHRMLLTDKGLPQTFNQLWTDSTESCKALPYCSSSKLWTDTNESILSLLVALHSKLSGQSDSYRPTEGTSVRNESGPPSSGHNVIGQLLDRISHTSQAKFDDIQRIRRNLFPTVEEVIKAHKVDAGYDKEERRRRVKERQEKLMAEFASKQKAFLQKTMENDEGAASAEFSESASKHKTEYECVICGQMSTSDEERPMGMVVLLQATSVLGHAQVCSDIDMRSQRRLPCSDEERCSWEPKLSLSEYMEKRIDHLTRNFDNKFWQLAVNIGWEGGVHVQSCGHYLHIHCYESYMQSLKTQSQQSSRHQGLNVERGEYSCPLCRQLANTVIPLTPMLDEACALVAFRKNKNSRIDADRISVVASELSGLMASSLSERESRILKFHMHAIMEDLTNSTYAQYRAVLSGWPNSSSAFLFVCSIARTNLEIELLQRRLCPGSVNKKKCFVPLLHVLSMHSRFLTQAVPTQIWTQLTGQSSDDSSCVAVVDTEVPLLLRDCIAILLQIVLTLPLNIDKAYFSCVVQVLFNVVYVQMLTQLSCNFNVSQRRQFGKPLPVSQEAKSSSNLDFASIMAEILFRFRYTPLYLDDEDMDVDFREKNWCEEEIECYIQAGCVQYLRIAALLQSHLYMETFPGDYKDLESEFKTLCHYLELTAPNDVTTPVDCLNWAVNEPLILIKTWCEDYANFVNKSVIAARNLIEKPLMWSPPALLKLPHNYNQIFQFYHHRTCSTCHGVPKDPSLCLVCGTMVCLRESCCRQLLQYEAVVHSLKCGAGTAMYLAVNSSTIIVIRGKRACLWGSVYLDSYGEEDRDLKRGRPLYLNEERYNLLQSQWYQHCFNHTNKRWVWHKDNL